MGLKPEDLLLLIDRPNEPIFLPKGERSITIDVPNEYFTDRFRPLADYLKKKFGTKDKVIVKPVRIPDLSEPMKLGRRDNFSLFIPRHQKMAAQLINIFMSIGQLEELMSVAAYARDRINPYLFMYSLSVAILHRKDTKKLRVPPFHEIFPEKYMDRAVFAIARAEASIIPAEKREPVEIPVDYTASDLDFEHRVAYFREDLGINQHHWHWHLVYPGNGPMQVVNKDRRGELFYYMHQQVVARYNFERLCNSLGRVKRFLNWSEPIAEAYFPKLDTLVASKTWPARVANTKISDIDREVDGMKFDIQDLERWRDRIMDAISSQKIIVEGRKQHLCGTKGIDTLGNMVEATILSPNKPFYGDLHNMGHMAISLSHDPNQQNLETFGVMGDSATAMRDPVFYRWHAFIDDLFAHHKNMLPSYTVNELDNPGVTISDVEVNPEGGQKNRLTTFWQQSDVDISMGLDFTSRGPMSVRLTHLQHTPFTYTIKVSNQRRKMMGTCRIFLAPKVDERGLPFDFKYQRNMFIELDKFTVDLTEVGDNVIKRKSTSSTVTIPYDMTFPSVNDSSKSDDDFNYCGCGWPQHMLIPKGAKGGFPCRLFVMISNYDDDKVDQCSSVGGSCKDAASYCGLKDALYPDKRSMGYPFDRPPRETVKSLDDFMTDNMKTIDVTIDFLDKTVKPSAPGVNKQPPTEPK